MVRQHHGRNVRLTATTAVLAATFCWCSSMGAPACAAEPQATVRDAGLAAALTHQRGDARRGEAVAVNSDRGNCIICHRLPIAELAPEVFGDLGPSLAGVGARLSPAQLRLRIVDARRVTAGTLMPPYHAVDALYRVDRRHAGRPILSRQDVEDLVAYLATLQ
jgi:sulfur-oxidizing protein SoxX